jgi:hypothetical protein
MIVSIFLRIGINFFFFFLKSTRPHKLLFNCQCLFQIKDYVNGQSFPLNWVEEISSNLIYKNNMCFFNMCDAHVVLIGVTRDKVEKKKKNNMCISYAIKTRVIIIDLIEGSSSNSV